MNLDIELRGDGCAAAGRCTTLARGGMFVECSNRPTVATPVAFTLGAGGPSPTMHGTGVVAWTGHDGYGIEFTRQSAGFAEGVAKIISQQPSFADRSA